MMTITRLLKCTSGWPLKGNFAVIAFLLLSVTSINAQSITIKGQMTAAENGAPLPAANVMVKGTTNGTATDLDGNYTISAKAKEVLVFSYIGYESKEVVVTNQTVLNVSLTPEATNLNDVVVIGYGTQKKKDLTGSVAVVNVDDAKKTVTYDVAKMLQGQAAGVTVQSSGEPGGFVNIKIRGISSFTNNNPLFVIDGIIVDAPNDFAPGDIETIQILKDASSAAIYGVRGANGVVIITTKKGKAGKVSVSFKSLVGFQNVAKKISVTDRVGYQKITNAAMVNSGQAMLPANDPSSASFIDNVDTDWQDAAFKTGVIQNQSFTVNGGSEKLAFNFNVDNFSNTSWMETPQDYKRISTNLNINANLGKFKFGSKLAFTESNKERFAEYLSGTSSMTQLLQAIPTMPVYDPNRLGGYGGADNATQRAITLNVIGWNNLVDNNSKRDRFVGNIWGEYEIIPGLKYTLRASADQLSYGDRLYIPPSDLGWYYITTNAESSLDVANGTVTRTVIDNLLNYNKTFGKHKVEALLGWVQERNDYYSHNSRGVGFDNGEISKLQYADAISASEYEGVETRVSYISRLDYAYDDRYLLTANFRQDRSSLFPEHNNTGNFYSVSGAWKIHNDIKLPSWMNTAKLRAGYGLLGNNTIGRYGYTSSVNNFAGYDFGNNLAPGTTAVTVVDPNIKWEETTTTNVALEVGMLNNKLQFSAEYFIKKSTDLLANVPLPYSTGSFPAFITTNAGNIKNTGLEFALSYSNQDHPFKYTVSANLGTLKNEVTKIGNDDTPIYGTNSKTEVGRSMGELYVYETEGIFQNQAEIDAHAVQPGAVPGDVAFKDVNGDGQITDQDRSFQGVTIPKFSFGFNFNASYKNFDMSLFFQGHGGNKIYNGTYNSLMIGGLTNHSTDMLNFWSPDNTDTNIPRPDQLETNQNARPSDRFIQNGDYLRLQSAELGYSLPFKNNKFIERARVYVSGQNLFTLTGYKGYDPDFNYNDGTFSRGYEYGSYPNPRTFIFGVELNF
ncbi:MAG: TonB-dependent receptor [Flavobacterium sp.]|nr:TonB-dependent receptor [Flavobacterium sp.]